MTTKKKKEPIAYLFIIMYGLELVGILICGLIGIGGYSITKTLSVIFLSALYITAYVHELTVHRKLLDIIYYSLVFLGCLILFLLYFYSSAIFIFIALVYSAVMAGLTALRFTLVLRARGDLSATPSELDIKPFLAIPSLLLFPMMTMMTVNFVSESYLAWALIPATIITLLVLGLGYILMHDLLKAWVVSGARKVGTLLSIIIMTFFVAYGYSYTTTGAVNCVFDDSVPTHISCTVLDKDIRSGSRTPTQYEVKVEIDGDTEWIQVSSSEYDDIDIGDNVTIDHYSGALNFGYYLYSEAD